MTSVMFLDSSGFYNAPVCKGLIFYMAFTCGAFYVPALTFLKKYLNCKLPDIFYRGEYWRIITSKASFLEIKDIVFGAILIYTFRIFERRFGSHKFASYVVCSYVISVVLEVSTVLTLQWFGVDLLEGGFLSSGPYGVLFSLFVNYYADIPHTTRSSVANVFRVRKILPYFLGFQLCYASYASLISAGCGIVAGLIYRKNLFGIRRIPWVPKYVAKACDKTIGRLIASSPPHEVPVGATLELQRQEQYEMWEQQMMRSRDFRNGPAANGDVHFMQNMMGMRRGPNSGLDDTPREEQIQTLVEMGFERERVIRALQTSQNDVNAATHFLLQHT